MKQIVLSLIILVGFSRIFAQCAPDVSQTQPGFSPDSLPPACVGEAYNQTVTLVFANDTSISTPLGNVTIEFLSYRITSITNLAPGISYECDNDSCLWPIVQNQVNRGCVRFFGTPTTAGTDTMIVSVLANLNTTLVPPTTVPVANPFTVKAAGTCTSTSASSLTGRDALRLYPNPGNRSFRLDCPEGARRIEVRDLTGKLIYDYASLSGFTGHEVSAENWHDGVYFVQVTGEKQTHTLRWIRQ